MNNTVQPLVLDPAGRDHYGEARALQARGPITRVELPDGVIAWVASHPALIRQLVADPRMSKDPRKHWTLFRDGRIDPSWPLGTFVNTVSMFTTDGDDHRRQRSLVAPAFAPKRVKAMSPRIERVVTAALDDLVSHGHGPDATDLREHFTYPVPLEVINTLLGVPDDMRAALRDVVEGIFATAATLEERQAGEQRLHHTLSALVEHKRGAPADDVISALIDAHDDATNSRLDHDELVGTLLLLIGAGHETTTNLIGNAVVALLTHPEQLTQVRDGSVSWDAVIDETLRWHAPITHVPMYFPTTDIDLGDSVVLRKGDALMLSVAAAGRDQDTHGVDADRFDITRQTREQHVAFGHGPHFCLGAVLARLEARIALPALFTRFPNLTLAMPPQDLRPQASLIANGFQSLPVRLGAAVGPAT